MSVLAAILLPAILLLVWSSACAAARPGRPYKFPAGLELREAEACVDEPLQLACGVSEEIVVVSASLYSEMMSRDVPCSIPSYNRQYTKGPVLHYLNHKCTSEQKCEFNLWDDVPGAANNLTYWQQGIIVARYVCINESEGVQWCGGVASGRSGWLKSPGYPKLYMGPDPCVISVQLDPGQRVAVTFTDIQLKEADIGVCRDNLTLEDTTGVLLQRCGTLHRPVHVLTQQHVANITLHTHLNMVPARGFLAYYKAIGCPSPPVPQNGSVVFRNSSHAELVCRDGQAFFSSDGVATKHALLACEQQRWPQVDDCVDLTALLDSGNISHSEFQKLYNLTTSATDGRNTGSVVLDLIVPVVVMSVLVLGNVFIILVIFYCRRAVKAGSSDEWDSIKSNPEPPDESDPAPVPSRV